VIAGDLHSSLFSQASELVRDGALNQPVRYTSSLEPALPVLVQSVNAQGFEGLVAKRPNSVYEPGQRTGAWMKTPANDHSFSSVSRSHCATISRRS
jgi:ATP-dependent DNA ligase